MVCPIFILMRNKVIEKNVKNISRVYGVWLNAKAHNVYYV